jgi:hypothetical protein
MARQIAQYYPQRVSEYVPLLSYHSDVRNDGQYAVNLGSPVALDADGIVAAQSVAAGGSLTSFASTYIATTEGIMGRFGRNVTVVLSGAGAGNVVITGRDYLNQKMSETIALNGNTPVLGVKAFKYVDSVTWPVVGAVTMNVGWGNALGLPFKSMKLDTELVAGVSPSAGTFVAGALSSVTQTATTADPRGTYLPHSSFLPDGTRTYELICIGDINNLHGNAHYSA